MFEKLKEINQHKVNKIAAVFAIHIIFFLIGFLLAKYGGDIHDIIDKCEKNPIFWLGYVIFVLSTSFLIVTFENRIDHFLRLLKFKKTKKNLQEIKELINKRILFLETSSDTNIHITNAKEYLSNYDNSISNVLNRTYFEIDKGGVDSDSFIRVMDALQSSNVKEIYATSDSPLNIWFISEMMCYIVMQMKISLCRNIPVKRYILENIENNGIADKFNPRTRIYDEHGVIKEIHSNAMELFVLSENEIPESIKGLSCKSILSLKSVNDDLAIWTFSYDKLKLKYCFTAIDNCTEKLQYSNAIQDIQNANPTKII